MLCPLTLLALSAPVLTQDAPAAQDTPSSGAAPTVEERLDRLERENDELRRQLGAVSVELEGFEFRDIIPTVGDSVFGLGPGASKIYQKDQGVSIGGYGEAIYQGYAGADGDELDFTRAILYFGYRFDERWVFNSEIEIEHADSIFLEFAYLEYLARPELNFRAGALLVPMGFVNEMHEPTTFRGATRPDLETRLMPSTWRENGLGIVGDAGDFSYRVYGVNGFSGAGDSDSGAGGYTSQGLRGGRQKGSLTAADDFALTGRLDWNGIPGLTLGVAGYHGDAAQDDADVGDLTTTIYDLHAEFRSGGWWARALYSEARVSDTELLYAADPTKAVGERMRGWYAELGYDLMTALAPESSQQLIPWVRYETVDTQASLAAGLDPDDAAETTNVAFGVDWLPIPNIVFKAGYRDYEDGGDRLEASLGYVF
jgi:hypothetical protein